MELNTTHYKEGAPIDAAAYLAGLQKRGRKAPHEVSAIANLIEEKIGFTACYTRGYWLRRFKGMPYLQAEALVREALTKREPGSWLSWKLKPKGV